MKPVLIKSSGKTELYFYESEEQLSSHLSQFSIPKEDWATIDLIDFPGAEIWGDCFQLEDSNISFNFDKAKENSKKLLDFLYLRKKSLILGNLKEVEVLLDLYLPDGGKNPAIKKVAQDLSVISKDYSDYRDTLDGCNEVKDINDALMLVKESWDLTGEL